MACYVSQRAAADCEMALRARVSAQRIRMRVRETAAFASTRRKRFAPEEFWDQPCGRQLTHARAGTGDRHGSLVRDVAVLAQAAEVRRRRSAAETATAKTKEAIPATARHTAA
eukprot:867077-Pleurochrysis_carterae.AAC.1